MKALFLLMFIPCISLAGQGRDTWRKASKKERAALVTAYQNWFAEHSSKNDGKLSGWENKKTSFIQLLSDAWATEGMDCIYAGWPSKKQGQSCLSPSTQNPDYQSGSCSSSEMQCQPLLFGAGLCVGVASRSERNSAFSNCSRRFEASGRTAASVVEEVASTDDGETRLLALLDFADQICASGSQAGSGMCNRLQRQVASIRAEAERNDVEVVVNDEPVRDPVIRAEIVEAVRLVPGLSRTGFDPSPEVRACVMPVETLTIGTIPQPQPLAVRVPEVTPTPEPRPESRPEPRREVAGSCFQNVDCQPWDAQADANATEENLYNRARACEEAAHRLGQGHPCFLTVINSVSVLGNNMELRRLAILAAEDAARQAEYNRLAEESAREAERQRSAWEAEQRQHRARQEEYRRQRAEYERQMRARGLEPEPER